MQRKQSLAAENQDENQDGDVLDSAPVISMVTNHTNGTLNLWQLTFDDKSKFSQVKSSLDYRIQNTKKADLQHAIYRIRSRVSTLGRIV